MGGRVSDVELQPAAVSAMAVRFRASGMELGRARDAHAAAADEAVDPVASAHARAVHRWTEGLRVAAAALVEVGTELDACVRATTDGDEQTAATFRGIRL